MSILARGGNAVDAAIATNAAIAITAPHLCGMGGDLFALVHDGHGVHALNATGRAGSGSDAAVLRAQGLTEMPFRHDVRAVTVPGCVDGWCALHAKFGRLPLAQLLAPAVRLAEQDHDLGTRSVGQGEARLQGGTRIHAGTNGSQQPMSTIQTGGPVRGDAGQAGREGPPGSARGESHGPGPQGQGQGRAGGGH